MVLLNQSLPANPDIVPINQPEQLLNVLESLTTQQDPHQQSYSCIHARREHGVRSALLNQRGLAVVLHGCKHLRGNGFDLQRQRGDVFVIARETHCDALNSPELTSGIYLTLMIPFCDEVLAAARLLRMQPVTQQGPAIVALRLDDLWQTLAHWAASLQSGDQEAARLALVSLVLQLANLGHAQLLAPAAPTVSDAIRAKVSQQPARPWRSADFEEELGVSGATLRRWLAAEQTSFSSLVTEARLTYAMQLLYTTRWPIKTVAAKAGYQSVGSFSQRFRAQYGLEPGAIGNSSDN